MNADEVRGVAIIGTIGVGKTTVAEAISDRLADADLRHGLVDLDWLGQVYPAPDPTNPFSLSLALRNLAVAAPNFLSAGARYMVVAATMTSRAELGELRRALVGVSLGVVLLTAPAEDVARRIRERDSGRLRDDFLARTDPLARAIEDSEIHDFVVDNGGRPATEVAEEILVHLGWLPA